MVCPSRKNQMVKQLIRNKEYKEIKKDIKEKKISEEEHKERMNKLKGLGLIK